jgi:hypothetical protein
MGLSCISKSQVSKLCKDIDERVGAAVDRPIDGSGRICGLMQPTCGLALAPGQPTLDKERQYAVFFTCCAFRIGC